MDLKGKRVLVFGSGKSGIGAAELLGQVGACPVLYDGNPDLDKEAVLHKTASIKETDIYAGGLPEEVQKSLDLAVLSPGVPTDLPLVKSFYDRVKFRLQNDTTGMELSVGLDTLELKADRMDLKNKEINVRELRVVTGDIFLRGGKGNEEKDTTAATPFDWKFYLEGLELSQISYNMETPTLPLLSARLERGMISKGEVDIGKQEIDVQTVAVAEGECRIQTAASETVPETVAEELTDTTSLWTVKAARVEVKNYASTAVSFSPSKATKPRGITGPSMG